MVSFSQSKVWLQSRNFKKLPGSNIKKFLFLESLVAGPGVAWPFSTREQRTRCFQWIIIGETLIKDLNQDWAHTCKMSQ